MHVTGLVHRLGVVEAARPVAVDPDPLHRRPRETSCLPTIGTLFSAWHATTQALQPTQAARSIDIPQA
jgi:hypothetical protein